TPVRSVVYAALRRFVSEGSASRMCWWLDEISDRHGWDLRVHVSRTVTDPWTSHSPSLGAPN
ncbi:hypothetical protein ABZ372_43860, partial [Streptomyces sp. NPDC005921]